MELLPAGCQYFRRLGLRICFIRPRRILGVLVVMFFVIMVTTKILHSESRSARGSPTPSLRLSHQLHPKLAVYPQLRQLPQWLRTNESEDYDGYNPMGPHNAQTREAHGRDAHAHDAHAHDAQVHDAHAHDAHAHDPQIHEAHAHDAKKHHPYRYYPKTGIQKFGHENNTRMCTQAERLRHMSDVCKRLPKPVAVKSRLRNGLFDGNNGVMYCYVPKAAGTSWKNLLVSASGQWSSRKLPHVHSSMVMSKLGIKRVSDDQKISGHLQAEVEAAFKFMVVRHPLDRLISAWRDKLTQRNSPYLKGMGKKILNEYRKTPDPEYNGIPRFDEFVEYLKDSRYLDRHWRPVLRTCDPCGTKWDAILRTETGPEDSGIALQHLGNLSVPVIHRHEGEETLRNPVTKDLSQYFSRVSREAFRFLMHAFGADMELLGYVWDAEAMVSSCRIQTEDGGYCC